MIEARKKPTGIVVIAWTWIITGAYMIVSSMMSLASSSFVSQIPLMFGVPEEAGPGFGLVMNIIHHFAFLAAVQIVMAVVITISGVGLLYLRPWGRGAVEFLCWLSLLGMAGSFIAGMFMWSAMTRQLPLDETSLNINMGSLRIGAFMIGTILALACAIPLGVMIKYLRGEVVRNAIEQARGDQSYG
jgi:hypothetical protein